MYGLYIHIPYCVRKCLYCDFYSVEIEKGPLSRRLQQTPPDHTRFLDTLEAELQSLPSGFAPGTLFIGGGTPTELSDHDLDRLLKQIHRHIDLSRVIEWTCEFNPGTLTESKARLLKEGGPNRISLGVQSLDDKNLEFLGRIHSAAEAIEGYHLLREIGFDNLNLDIIFGLPDAGRHRHRENARHIVELQPEHTSFYCLMYEEGTPFTRLRDRGYIQEPAGNELRIQYEEIREILRAGGYEQYEISNFSRPGFSCRHNLLYWGAGEYIGCGPSAHSHWNGTRYANVRSIDRYIEMITESGCARDFEERLAPEEKARETLVMSLRRVKGIDASGFEEATGYRFEELCGPSIDRLVDEGLLEKTTDHLRLTPAAHFVSNAVFSELV